MKTIKVPFRWQIVDSDGSKIWDKDIKLLSFETSGNYLSSIVVVCKDGRTLRAVLN